MDEIPNNDFLFSLEEDKTDEKDSNHNLDMSKNPHMKEAKNAQKHTMWDSLKELPGKADTISKNFKLWANSRKNLGFYKKYLDRVKSGLFDQYGGEAQVTENSMLDDPVMILKNEAQVYIKEIVDNINKLYEEVLGLSKKLENSVTAEQCISIIKHYTSDYVDQNKKGDRVDKDKQSWRNKILDSTKYKIAKILTRNDERKIYGYTSKNMVLKGYPKPNHLIVTMFVADPQEQPHEQSVRDIFNSVDSFDILARSDKEDIFNVSNMTKAVLHKTVDNKVMNEIKLSKSAALNHFKSASMDNKKEQGQIIDSIWDGIKEACKELLSRKNYIIECINVYYDMILRIDKLAVKSINAMLDVENAHRDKKYDKHLAFGHKGDLGDKVKQGVKNIATGKTGRNINNAYLTQGKSKDQLNILAKANKLANQLSK